MKALLLDTNIVSILFKPDHTRYRKCLDIVAGNQWCISFMTRAELLLWPKMNQWGATRSEDLYKHVDLCTTLFADDDTCELWSNVMSESRVAGRPITVADAWVAVAARQCDLALVTADYRDFEHLKNLTLIPVSNVTDRQLPTILFAAARPVRMQSGMPIPS
jgi:predicted nucleic acid-binding protein